MNGKVSSIQMAASSDREEQDCGEKSTFDETKKEENDKLLYLWQRASFMDSGNNIPREVADSLRLKIALLSSYHSKLRAAGQSCFGTGMLLTKELRRYSNVMDTRDEAKGMNNLCGTVDTLLGDKVKVSGCKDWKSSLDIDVVRDLPAYKKFQKSLQSTDTQTVKNSQIATPNPSNFLSFNPASTAASSSSAYSSASTIPKKPHPEFTTPSVRQNPQSAVLAPRSTLTPPVRKVDVAGGRTRGGGGESSKSFQYPTSMSDTSSSSSWDQGDTRLPAFSVVGGRGQHGEPSCGPSHRGGFTWGSGQQVPHQGAVYKRSRLNEEVNDDDDDDDGNAVQVFSTARDEYIKQQQKRFRGGGGGGGGRRGGRGGMSGFGAPSSVEYGSSKKSLGTRRGASNKFVPPVRKDKEDCYNGGMNEVQSRVFRGSGGGGQTERRGGDSSGCLPPELENNENLRNIEPRMVELILNEIVDHSAPVQWGDIAGLEFAKATINEVIVWPMMRPDLFTGLRGPPKGVLLFGPPGTGKTLIGKCIASQVDATFFSISASSLTSKWIGEGEKMVRALFAVARCYQPAVIFMDEIDSLLTQRSDTEHESSRRIKTEFLVQLDGATTSEADRLLVIGATNRPQEIDEAARRRLVKRLYIPLPEAEARRKIVENLMRQQPASLSEQELQDIARRTDGYSGADMANLCREAAYGPVREAAASILHISASEMRDVLGRDFTSALEVIKPSVSEKDLELYISWNKQFGCGR